MLFRVLVAASALFLQIAASEASMNDQTILGTVQDPRVASCGVRIDGGAMAVVRPFLQASTDVAGTVKVALTKTSRSGTSVINQSGRFSSGTLGDLRLAVERPSRIRIHLEMVAADGRLLCGLDEAVELTADAA